jgi:hypothetical protein
MAVDEAQGAARLAALRAEIEDLQRRYPAERPAAAAADPAPLPCPSCGGTMRPGTASVRASLLGLIFGGWSSAQHLYFRPAGGDRKSDRVVVGSGQSSRAWRCDHCGAVLVCESKQAWTAG